jgi:hypothetical protein
MVTLEEYREMLGDRESSDEQIISRLQYLEALCRNIIQAELATYAETITQPKSTS